MSSSSQDQPTSALDRLASGTWRCACCDADHEGIFDLVAYAPDCWPHEVVLEPNSALRFDGDFLSDDFCVLAGEHFFIRCGFDIPVHGLDRTFGLGCWSSLSGDSLDLYLDHFNDGFYGGLGPWTGWFANSLVGFSDTLNQPCWVYPQLNRERPLITLANADHPLAVAQAEGIDAERLLEIYAASGHAPG